MGNIGRRQEIIPEADKCTISTKARV